MFLVYRFQFKLSKNRIFPGLMHGQSADAVKIERALARPKVSAWDGLQFFSPIIYSAIPTGLCITASLRCHGCPLIKPLFIDLQYQSQIRQVDLY